MPSPAPLPIYLLPGMGADHRLFTLQKLEFPQLIVQEWLEPEPRESLPDYARRMAASLQCAGPCLVGGVSFGAMVALEMTRHLPARACCVISSVRTPRELPFWTRVMGPLAWLMPPNSDRWLAAAGWLALKTCGPVLPRQVKSFCVHLSKTRSNMLPWACRAVLSWRATDSWPCPVYQLHGSADPIIPQRCVHPDQVIPEAGHLLTLTHPFVVNQFLRQILNADALTTAPTDDPHPCGS